MVSSPSEVERQVRNSKTACVGCSLPTAKRASSLQGRPGLCGEPATGTAPPRSSSGLRLERTPQRRLAEKAFLSKRPCPLKKGRVELETAGRRQSAPVAVRTILRTVQGASENLSRKLGSKGEGSLPVWPGLSRLGRQTRECCAERGPARDTVNRPSLLQTKQPVEGFCARCLCAPVFMV